MVALSSKTEARLAGLANVRNARPLAPEAEIRTTNATSKKVVDFRNLSHSVSNVGYTLPNIDAPTILYNNNDACLKWSYNMTLKAARHIELCKNSVREWVQEYTLNVKHVSGKLNPANIFTKKMRDGAHFW
jgi:hypothetical protein